MTANALSGNEAAASGSMRIEWRWRLLYRADQSWPGVQPTEVDPERLLEAAQRSSSGPWFEAWVNQDDDPTRSD